MFQVSPFETSSDPIKWPDQVTRSSDPMKLSFRDDLRAVPKDFISNPSSPNSPLKTLSPPSKQLPFGEGSRHTHLQNLTEICRFWKMLKNAILDAPTVTQFKYPQCKSSYHKALQFQNQPIATVTTSKYFGKCDWDMPSSVFLGVVVLFSSGCRCGVGFCFPFRSFMFSLFCSDFRVVFRCVFFHLDFDKLGCKNLWKFC